MASARYRRGASTILYAMLFCALCSCDEGSGETIFGTTSSTVKVVSDWMPSEPEALSPTAQAPAAVPSASMRPEPADYAKKQWEHASKPDGEQCRATLKAMHVKFSVRKDTESPDEKGCGVPHPVLVS